MYRRPRLSRATAGLATAVSLAALTGCGSGSDPIRPAAQAGAPACAQVTGRLPVTVLDRGRNRLAVAGAASWGKPAIVLRCGVPAPGPTTDRCVEVDGLDWVFTPQKKAYQFVTFGRDPAVEVSVPTSIDRTTATDALIDLDGAVRPLKRTGACT